MCTMIAIQAKVNGRGKSGTGWFKVDTTSVSYDHPFEMPLEYTLNLDFTNLDGDASQRVAVELDAASARRLVQAIGDALGQAEQGGFIRK